MSFCQLESQGSGKVKKLSIEVLNPESIQAYDQYLLNQSCSLLYHSTKYKNLLKSLLKCEEKYLLAMEEGRICGVLPLLYIQEKGKKAYNSLPYYGSHGGVIADNLNAYNELINFYNAIANDESTISSTIVSNPFVQQQDIKGIQHNFTDYRIGQYTNISAREDSVDEVVVKVESSARRNVKKAISSGVTVEVDPLQMECFLEIHQENIRSVGGIPKTNEFFALVSQHFTPGLDFDLYVAKKDGIVVAGLLLFYFNQTVEYFTPATHHDYRSIQPLALTIATAMADASGRGFTRWNWGGTWASQSGVYRFKKKWAAQEKEYYYYTQLNELSILDWSQDKILKTFPNFFIVPFSALHTG